MTGLARIPNRFPSLYPLLAVLSPLTVIDLSFVPIGYWLCNVLMLEISGSPDLLMDLALCLLLSACVYLLGSSSLVFPSGKYYSLLNDVE